MQAIDQEPNSKTETDSRNFGDTDLRKIIEAGRVLTADEQRKLLKVLGRHCSKRIKKLIKERLTIPINQWRNYGSYAKVFFRCNGDVVFIESQHYRKELVECRNEFLGFS